MEKYVNIKNSSGRYLIKCKLYIPEKIDGAFIMCHGYSSSKESRSVRIISNVFLKKNIMSISFDFPMHGKSNVTRDCLTVKNCIEDVNCVYKYLEKKYNPKFISIFGVSFGGYITLLNSYYNNNKFNQIFLRAPAIGIGDLFMKIIAKEDAISLQKNGYIKSGYSLKIEATKLFVDEMKENDLLKIKDYNKDLVIFHGGDDQTIPIKNSYDFKNNNKNANIEIIEIKGAHHVMDNSEIEDIAHMIVNKIK